jgi:hypothetical protein
MAVTVRLVDGTVRAFQDAQSARCDGLVFRVMRWNPEILIPEDVVGGVFDSRQVVLAEVSENGVVSERVAGLASSRSQ